MEELVSRRVDRRHLVVVTRPFEAAARQLGLFEPAGITRLLENAARGARPGLPGAGARQLQLRPVRHRGWLAPLWCGRVLGLRRLLSELRVNAQLAAAGAPVCQPVAVAAQRRTAPLWSAALATLRVEGARDGLEFLGARPDRRRTLRAAAACATALRLLHAAGGRHADLHLGNLLICESGDRTRALVVDLDGARIEAPPTPRRRMAELMRLYRSLLKWGMAERVGRRGCARFLSVYTGGDRRLRRALLARLPAERRRLLRHRIGYRLSRPRP